MSDKRACIVFKKDDIVGYLGEGPGPFVSLRHSSLPHPWLEHARFRARSFPDENPISHLVNDNKTYDAIIAALQKAGYRVEPKPYDELFLPPEQSATSSSEVEPLDPF